MRKVTIVPRGRTLGVTEQLPTEDRYNISRAELVARLDVMLGGRTSEEIVIGEVTTGAQNDVVQATQLARRMITRWGMSRLGLVAFDSQDEQPFLGYPMAPDRTTARPPRHRLTKKSRVSSDRWRRTSIK